MPIVRVDTYKYNCEPVTKKFPFSALNDCFSGKYAPKDKLFFGEGYTVSNLKDLTKKLINVNHENLNEADPFFDGVRELKR